MTRKLDSTNTETLIFGYKWFNGLRQDWGNSSASALELLQSCGKPLIQSIADTFHEYWCETNSISIPNQQDSVFTNMGDYTRSKHIFSNLKPILYSMWVRWQKMLHETNWAEHHEWNVRGYTNHYSTWSVISINTIVYIRLRYFKEHTTRKYQLTHNVKSLNYSRFDTRVRGNLDGILIGFNVTLRSINQ